MTISLHAPRARDPISSSRRENFSTAKLARDTAGGGAEREREKQRISTIKVALVCLAKVFLRPDARWLILRRVQGASHPPLWEFSFFFCRRFYSEAAFCALHTSRSIRAKGARQIASSWRCPLEGFSGEWPRFIKVENKNLIAICIIVIVTTFFVYNF